MGALQMTRIVLLAGAAFALVSTQASAGGLFGGKNDQSSAYKQQEQGTAEIPQCSHRIGTLAIVPPDKEWWRELNLGSPEAIIKVFVQQSGCFSMVNRDRSMPCPWRNCSTVRARCSESGWLCAFVPVASV